MNQSDLPITVDVVFQSDVTDEQCNNCNRQPEQNRQCWEKSSVECNPKFMNNEQTNQWRISEIERHIYVAVLCQKQAKVPILMALRG